ncbi:MAG TPA: amidohydrolase family protein [Opitutaceae bacterium]
MNYFDASTWIGKWPFAFVDAHTPRSLAAHLKAHGMRRALVSPLDAVFAPGPGPANRDLLRATQGVATLVPVPVVNPSLANWREELIAVTSDPRVRAVRLLPAYHNFRLGSRDVDELAAELIRRRLRLIVQVRLIDERHEFHAMNIKPVKPADFAAFAVRHPRLRIMASGFLRSEILAIAKRCPRALFDLSFAEWHETIRHLLVKVPVRQLVFASHTPLLITAAARAKLDRSGLPKSKLAAIASRNFERWLG